MQPHDCAILVPVMWAIEPECESRLQVLASRGYPVRILRGCSQIDLARSILATQAMNDGFAETMWIDSDILFEPDHVDVLRAHGLPMVAGLYPKKGPKGFAGKFLTGGVYRFGQGGGLLEMDYVGMGFTHVRRVVYETIEQRLMLPRVMGGFDIAQPICPYFVPKVIEQAGQSVYLSEDYSFCHRARQVGLSPVADTRLKIGHIGRHAFTWDNFALAQYEAMEFSIDVPAVAPVSPPVSPLDEKAAV